MKAADPEMCEYVKTHSLFKKLEEELNNSKGQSLQKEKRLSLFFNISNEMDLASDNIEAKRRLDSILNTIEDCFSGTLYSPDNWSFDERMYPAQDDARRKSDHPNIYTYRHQAHYSHFGTNGSILIENLDGRVLLDRPGKDELTVGNLRERPSSIISRIG